ncbi:MAG: hypothetical protein ACRCYY_13945 [Trueperaceae bacterium]
MFFLMILGILVISFFVIFGLWFVIWSFTMNGSELMHAMVEETHSSATR